MLLDLSFERGLRHCTDHGVHVLAVLEEQDARDRSDVEPHGRALIAVHVELGDPRPAGVLPGELVEIEQLDGDVFGRIGAQTAKQIVLQRIREVERDQVFDRFASREGEMITGTVNRVEPRAIILDVGNNVEAILQTSEQSAVEHYRIGQNVKAYVLEVRRSTRGPQIFVSRTHKGFLRRLFEQVFEVALIEYRRQWRLGKIVQRNEPLFQPHRVPDSAPEGRAPAGRRGAAARRFVCASREACDILRES